MTVHIAVQHQIRIGPLTVQRSADRTIANAIYRRKCFWVGLLPHPRSLDCSIASKLPPAHCPRCVHQIRFSAVPFHALNGHTQTPHNRQSHVTRPCDTCHLQEWTRRSRDTHYKQNIHTHAQNASEAQSVCMCVHALIKNPIQFNFATTLHNLSSGSQCVFFCFRCNALAESTVGCNCFCTLTHAHRHTHVCNQFPVSFFHTHTHPYCPHPHNHSARVCACAN